MSSQIRPEHQRRIIEAKTHLKDAERELDSAMQALEAADRANKTMITSVLRVAFEKVTAARTELASVLEDISSSQG